MRGAAPSEASLEEQRVTEIVAPLEACPSVHRPFAQLDGALVRIRIPGGTLSTDEVRSIARAADGGGATLEITSRANLQLRGVPLAAQGRTADALLAAGVVAADPAADERRNILASPTAGTDPDELLDVRPYIAGTLALLEQLNGTRLSPKFGVVIDGGGAVHVRGRTQDVAVGAVTLDGQQTPLFEVHLAEALPIGPPTGHQLILIRPADLLAFIEAALDVAGHAGRMSAALGSGDRRHLVETIAESARIVPESVDDGRVLRTTRRSSAPMGILPERRPGASSVVAMPLLGRLDPATLTGIGDLADAVGSGEVRLTPWRSVLLPGVPQAATGVALSSLADLGLAIDATDPAVGVVACAGAAGCPAGLAATQAHAAALISHLRAAPPRAPFSVHLSGCPKSCASHAPHDITLIAGPSPGTYELVNREARTLARDLRPQDAIDAVLAAALGNPR